MPHQPQQKCGDRLPVASLGIVEMKKALGILEAVLPEDKLRKIPNLIVPIVLG